MTARKYCREACPPLEKLLPELKALHQLLPSVRPDFVAPATMEPVRFLVHGDEGEQASAEQELMEDQQPRRIAPSQPLPSKFFPIADFVSAGDARPNFCWQLSQNLPPNRGAEECPADIIEHELLTCVPGCRH